MLSAVATSSQKRPITEAGATDYLIKPLDDEILLALVDDSLTGTVDPSTFEPVA